MVTDEMVEKAANAIAEKRGYAWPGTFDAEEIKIGRENLRAALEAALSAQVQDVVGGVPEEVREAATEVITAHECGMLRQTTWWENAAFLLAEYAMSSGDYAAAPAKQEGGHD